MMKLTVASWQNWAENVRPGEHGYTHMYLIGDGAWSEPDEEGGLVSTWLKRKRREEWRIGKKERGRREGQSGYTWVCTCIDTTRSLTIYHVYHWSSQIQPGKTPAVQTKLTMSSRSLSVWRRFIIFWSRWRQGGDRVSSGCRLPKESLVFLLSGHDLRFQPL